MSSNHDWDLIISPNTKVLDLGLKELWRYRYLLKRFVLRDFKAFYKQTILGPLWFFVQPIFTTIVYVFVFGGLANLSTDKLPQPLFYLSGIVFWSFFSNCLTRVSSVFRSEAGIFGKVYFPRLIAPISFLFSNLIRFGVQLILLAVMTTYFAVSGGYELTPTWVILLFPVFLLLTALQAAGLGLIISGFTTKYRDLGLFVSFGVQLLMYSTTVIYPLSALDGYARILVALNPMTFILEGVRKGLFGQGTFEMHHLLYVAFATALFLFLGLISFRKVEKTFIDTI